MQQQARKPARDTNSHATGDDAGMVTGSKGCRAGRENFPQPRQGWWGQVPPPPPSPAASRFIGAFALTGVYPVERMGMRG